MTHAGYQIVDATEQFDKDLVDSVSLAVKDDKYQIEFFDFKSENDAIYSYNLNEKKFEDRKEAVSSYSSVKMGNHASYKLTTGGQYLVVSRIGDTLIYIDTTTDYKDEINDILKELGY